MRRLRMWRLGTYLCSACVRDQMPTLFLKTGLDACTYHRLSLLPDFLHGHFFFLLLHICVNGVFLRTLKNTIEKHPSQLL